VNLPLEQVEDEEEEEEEEEELVGGAHLVTLSPKSFVKNIVLI